MPDQRASTIQGGVAEAVAHDSAARHVSGDAIYIDDIAEPARCLHIALGWCREAVRAKLNSVDLTNVHAADGVVDVISFADLKAATDISPVGKGDEPVFADGDIVFWGQPVFAVAATSLQAARDAALLATFDIVELEAQLDIAEAWQKDDLVWPVGRMQRGEADEKLLRAEEQGLSRIDSEITIGAQDHFYLEGQVSLAVPGEDGDMTVYCSTQHPSEVQEMVARVLGVHSHAVTVEVRRMGGGFGGKETQANLYACIAALFANRTGRAAKCRLDRDEDMIMTGKRHDFLSRFSVSFDNQGVIDAVAIDAASRAGYSADLSGPVNDRTLFHADNGYFYPNVRLACFPCRTNTVSNTAFRGFGGPQGMVIAERIIEEISVATGIDALEVRKRNLYGKDERNVTPYHMRVEDNILPELIDKLEREGGYWPRRQEVREFNASHKWIKRGLALTPVKFGISFTMTAYNQAGALVHIYKDGSVALNHGGTEMGQGLYIKIAQIVANELMLDLDKVKITATTTSKVPNTSATAASSGSDLNGMAAQAAARMLKDRLTAFAAEQHQTTIDKVVWLAGRIEVLGDVITFERLVHDAYMARISLSATGFYKTPKIHWDRETGQGRPFYYFTYGAALSEVTVDRLTGEYRVDDVQIIHDVGRSLNPAIDKGQIEGGFIQGMGWLTTEELVWDETGRLRTHAPSTYKIPTAADRPRSMNISLAEGIANRENTIHRSKAVGEPPFMLAISVLAALSDAVASVADYKSPPRLDPPATPESVLKAMERLEHAG